MKNNNTHHSSHSTQICLVSLISLNQLKRQFEVFQQQLFSQLTLIQKQSMEDIISLWKLFSHRVDGNNKLTARHKNSLELENAFEIINQKQSYIAEIQNKLGEAEQAKEELLSILQRQTELCTQIRDQQVDQAAAFNTKMQTFEKIIKQKDVLVNDLKVEASVLKRLLKEQYQSKGDSIDQSLYISNPCKQIIQPSISKKLMKPRKSQVGIFSQSTNKRNSMSKSKDLKSMKLSSSNFSKTLKMNQSTQSIKSHIQKMIQKAVKQNCQKYRK